MSSIQTTPRSVPRKFREVLAPGVRAVHVPIVQNVPGMRPYQCFWNVRDVVEAHGGEAVYGWAITEWVGVLYQAEHHAVWRDPDSGMLVDVTPMEGDTETFFLAVPSMTWDGWQIPTRRWPVDRQR